MAVPVSPTLTVRLLVVAPARVNVYCPGFGVVPSRVSAASASAAATVITGKKSLSAILTVALATVPTV